MTDQEMQQALADLEAARQRIFSRTPQQQAAATGAVLGRIAELKRQMGAAELYGEEHVAGYERAARRLRGKAV